MHSPIAYLRLPAARPTEIGTETAAPAYLSRLPSDAVENVSVTAALALLALFGASEALNKIVAPPPARLIARANAAEENVMIALADADACQPC